MRTQELYVQLDGSIKILGDAPPELAALLGEGTRRRASSILPLHRGKRAWFLFLRLLFGERGRVAEWTRQWQGPWWTKVFATGDEFIHQSRKVCLKWEHERLEAFYETRSDSE